jgi:hypothetical protein
MCVCASWRREPCLGPGTSDLQSSPWECARLLGSYCMMAAYVYIFLGVP